MDVGACWSSPVVLGSSVLSLLDPSTLPPFHLAEAMAALAAEAVVGTSTELMDLPSMPQTFLALDKKWDSCRGFRVLPISSAMFWGHLFLLRSLKDSESPGPQPLWPTQVGDTRAGESIVAGPACPDLHASPGGFCVTGRSHLRHGYAAAGAAVANMHPG